MDGPLSNKPHNYLDDPETLLKEVRRKKKAATSAEVSNSAASSSKTNVATMNDRLKPKVAEISFTQYTEPGVEHY